MGIKTNVVWLGNKTSFSSDRECYNLLLYTMCSAPQRWRTNNSTVQCNNYNVRIIDPLAKVFVEWLVARDIHPVDYK